ncbi:hypothetical protein IWX78_001331 [Mycetocola sp. CAN_C7]|uniref:hypothetical protein n=1 Tax=Mycetocola sp. CAN_C7 TaxID=2787724 RepID=UPI0018C90E58
MRGKENPGWETGAIRSSADELNSYPIVPQTSDILPESDPGVFFRNSYAVLVRGKSIRRHLYFNLPAAARAVNRALARGDKADLVLVRLVPVDARHLDQSEAIE